MVSRTPFRFGLGRLIIRLGRVNWDPNYTIALIPPGGAIVVSLLVVMFGGSADAGQWAAVITFFVTLPFVVGRLIDRAK